MSTPRSPAASDALREGRFEAVGDEVERRPTGHLDRFVLEVREDEHGCVVGRLLAPPAAPIALPGAANRPEHVPTHHVGPARAQQQIACSRIGVVQRLVEMPAMKLHPAAAKRVLETLVRPCDVAVERDRHVACSGCVHTR